MAHRLLQAIKTSKPAFGIWQTIPGLYHCRTIGATAANGLAWVCLDCEHGLIPLQGGTSECITAITTANGGKGESPSVLVRVPATGASTGTGWQIKIALDAGAHGVIVPMVNTAAKAREIVQESRFPPIGRRGFGNPFTPSIWNQTPNTYLTTSNEHILVMVQIETKEAVENLEEIAATEGVDALFIGPFDLSLSFGYPVPSPDPHPEVEKIIAHIREVAHKNKKAVAFYCSNGAQAAKRAAEGFDIVNIASDVGALGDGINSHLKAALGGDGNELTSRKEGY